jgi:hypothetical protein
MPTTSKRGAHTEDFSLYAELWEFRITAMAMDHFFENVVDGNVPLTSHPEWWHRQVVSERVTRFSENWAIVFEGLARMRQRLEESSIPIDRIRVDESLRFEYHDARRGDEPITWERQR